MAIAVADSWKIEQAVGNTTTVSVSGFNPGDVAVVLLFSFNNGGAGVVHDPPTDDAGNVYTNRIANVRSSTFRSIGSLADATIVTPPTNISVFVNGGTAAGQTLVVLRLTGAYSIPDAVDENLVTADDPTSDSIGLSSDGIVISGITYDGDGISFDPPSGWTTAQELETSTAQAFSVAYRLVSAGTQSASWITGSSADYALVIGGYKALAAPPPELLGGYSPPNFGWRGLSQEQFRDIAIPQWSGLVDNQRMRKRAIRYEDINEVAYFAPAPLPITSVDYPDSATVTISIQVQGPDGAADNFNRSDSADLGTDWTPIFGEAPYTIASGLARPSNYSNFNNAEVFTGKSWSADQYSECIIINPHSGADSGAGIGVVVRGSTSERTYYGFVCNANAGFGWQLFKWVAGSFTSISTGGTAFASADVVRLEVIGTTLNVYRNGALFTTATDSSIVDGSPGIVLAPFSFDSMNENWSGGSISVDTLQAVDSATVTIDIQVSTTAPTAVPIAVDQANIGELIQNAAVATTSVLTTTQTVAPNALIVLTVNWFTAGSTVLQGVSGGGLTWTIDKHIESAGGECAAIVSAPAPTGLPSGTAITVDFGDTSSAARLIAGSSFLGLNLTATKVHASNAFIPNYTTNWAGSGFNTTTPTLLIGMTTSAGHGNPTSTPNGGEVEAHDFHDSAGQHVQIVNYEISTTPGFHQLGGAWSSDQTGTGDRKCVDIAYNAAEYHTETFTIITANDDGSGYWKDTVPYTWPPAESWVDETSNNIYVAKGEAVYYYANNGFWRWDTSGLPDAASIVSGTFAPCLISGDPNMGGSFIGDYYDFGGEPTVSADGIITVASPIWTPVTVSSVNSSGAGYQSFALTDLSGINKSGYTGIRASLDASGTTPPTGGFQSSLVWSSYELGNPASLVVSYYVPVGGPVDIFLPVDSATVLVDIQVDTTEVYTPGGGGTLYTDAATPLVDIQASGTELREVTDSATVTGGHTSHVYRA